MRSSRCVAFVWQFQYSDVRCVCMNTQKMPVKCTRNTPDYLKLCSKRVWEMQKHIEKSISWRQVDLWLPCDNFNTMTSDMYTKIFKKICLKCTRNTPDYLKSFLERFQKNMQKCQKINIMRVRRLMAFVSPKFCKIDSHSTYMKLSYPRHYIRSQFGILMEMNRRHFQKNFNLSQNVMLFWPWN